MMDNGRFQMFDCTSRMVKKVNNPQSDGYEISIDKLKKNPKLAEHIRKNNKCLPHLHLVGNKNENENTALLDLIHSLCVDSLEKLKFSWMTIDMPAEKLRTFRSLKEVTFDLCTIKNESILRFCEWCPNLTTLKFDEGVEVSEPAYASFKSSEQKLIQVKSLSIDFKGSSMKLTRDLLEALDRQFPSLETLQIAMDASDSFTKNEFKEKYEPLYFKNLKSFAVHSFVNNIERLFDYMAVSNVELTEFSFTGMFVTDELVDWIKSCTNLSKLTVDSHMLNKNKIAAVKDMQRLKKWTLSTKRLLWKAEDVIRIARANPHVDTLAIDSDYGNDDMEFGEKYKQMFADLAKERKDLAIKVFFHEEGREINISAHGFSEKKRKDNAANNGSSFSLNDPSMQNLMKFIGESFSRSQRQMANLKQ
ncbi:uncharacterized protein LOC119076477 [Bradysia coprophila]|uniref:uncharacterized protein LOC119076477 n=1 Tax=Bradysia coprophila TaxID=38358 RepID=UPI00187DA7FE|nr:uncharacterized protein LOC119076477 [Bradysia coprophila]